MNVSKSFKSIDLTKHRSQHSAQTHSLVSFLDQFKKTLILVHPACPQRYFAYLLQFDSKVKNPSVIVVILPGFFGQAVFLLTVFHCIIFCIDFDMFMRTSFVPTLYCYLS